MLRRLLRGRRPVDELGLREGGRFRPCSRDNHACSQSDDPRYRVEPIAFLEGEDGDATRARLLDVIGRWPRARVVTAEGDYLHVEDRTFVGFVDDLELHVNRELRVVEVHSASRLGHSDLGCNRKRVERLREGMRSA
ncbi:MAG: DUF1499 domain-containing protein [Acidobacteriota bacterium]